MESLLKAIEETKVGDEINIIVIRDESKRIEFKVTMIGSLSNVGGNPIRLDFMSTALNGYSFKLFLVHYVHYSVFESPKISYTISISF